MNLDLQAETLRLALEGSKNVLTGNIKHNKDCLMEDIGNNPTKFIKTLKSDSQEAVKGIQLAGFDALSSSLEKRLVIEINELEALFSSQAVSLAENEDSELPSLDAIITEIEESKSDAKQKAKLCADAVDTYDKACANAFATIEELLEAVSNKDLVEDAFLKEIEQNPQKFRELEERDAELSFSALTLVTQPKEDKEAVQAEISALKTLFKQTLDQFMKQFCKQSLVTDFFKKIPAPTENQAAMAASAKAKALDENQTNSLNTKDAHAVSAACIDNTTEDEFSITFGSFGLS